jgi:hypothetical protein
MIQINLTQKKQVFDRPAKQVPFWAILGHRPFTGPFGSPRLPSRFWSKTAVVLWGKDGDRAENPDPA